MTTQQPQSRDRRDDGGRCRQTVQLPVAPLLTWRDDHEGNALSFSKSNELTGTHRNASLQCVLYFDLFRFSRHTYSNTYSSVFSVLTASHSDFTCSTFLSDLCLHQHNTCVHKQFGFFSIVCLQRVPSPLSRHILVTKPHKKNNKHH